MWMSPERWERIGEIFHEAYPRSPEERAIYLDEVCEGDEALRREIDSLLATDEAAADFLDHSALHDAAPLLDADRDPDEWIDARIGPYRILSFLGAGGMGEVYGAEDPRLHRRVALKLLHGTLEADPERLHRFLQEARAASRLTHPNILTIHDIGEFEGRPYLVTELLEGETLRERLRNGPLPLDRALEIALQVVQGLAAAHAQGIIHRDLKPENLFLTHHGQVKLLDFGLAKLISEPAADEEGKDPAITTHPGILLGTVSYMAPEQLRHEEVDARSDLFSFGIVLHEMLTGERPFTGASVAETMAAILHDEPPRLATELGRLQSRIDRIVRRCLEKRPERRFQTALDLGFALETLETIEMDPPSSTWGGGRPTPPEGSATRESAPEHRARWVARSGWILAGLFLMIALGLLVELVRRPSSYTRIVPFTSFPGQKSRPVFSPDGNQIAFFWEGENGEAPGIYVKLIDTGQPLQLVSLPGGLGTSIAWSPDGRSVAFARPGSGRGMGVDEGGIFTVSALGGPERRLTPLVGEFAWSPDGKMLAIVTHASDAHPLQILLLTLSTGETRYLTQPPAGSFGDRAPAWSPDGRSIAFIRNPNFLVSDLWRIGVEGGSAERLTFDNLDIPGTLGWTEDGREILFTSPRGGLPSLWRIRATGGSPRRELGVGDYAYDPSVARRGERLAFVYRRQDRNIWRAPGPLATSGRDLPPVRLIASTREEVSPQISPDGSRIAFVSDRTGNREIWVCDREGQNAMQLTSFGGSSTGAPRWSPDSRQIVFDSRADGRTDIFVVPAEGGRPRRITDDLAEDVLPSWSRDGQSIYFGSRRSGEWQIWRVPVGGGPPEQVTTRGGYEAFEAVDGRHLYLAKREPGIWRIPVGGGEETLLLDRGRWGYWALLANGICLLDPVQVPEEGGLSGPVIEYLPFTTWMPTPLLRLDRRRAPTGAPGLAVSPKGDWILFWQADQNDHEIMLVEHFR
jgi:Tol biopolymer transport system component